MADGYAHPKKLQPPGGELRDGNGMIVKEITIPEPADKFGKAGYRAESQMAHYLKRKFDERDDVLVFNDLRLERQGEVAQIDHLVLHKFGLVLIESKSVNDRIEVNKQLEFTRVHGRKRKGMRSPIKQVERQREQLQKLLKDNDEQLRNKRLLGMVQPSFPDFYFQTFVAISDEGNIERYGCDPPQLKKADSVTDEIVQIIDQQYEANSFASNQSSVEPILPFKDDEMEAIRDFLLEQHTEAPPKTSLESDAGQENNTSQPAEADSEPPADDPEPPMAEADPQEHSCRHCQGHDLEILYGKYGYYFKCLDQDCSGNTSIKIHCDVCGKPERVRKQGQNFTRNCEACDTASHFHTNP